MHLVDYRNKKHQIVNKDAIDDMITLCVDHSECESLCAYPNMKSPHGFENICGQDGQRLWQTGSHMTSELEDTCGRLHVAE